MECSMIIHQPYGLDAYAVDSDTLHIRLRAKKGDFLRVAIHYKNLYDHFNQPSEKDMDILLDDGDSILYETAIQIPEKHFKYYFTLHRPDQAAVCFTADGIMEEVQPSNYFYFPQINDDDVIALPKWAEGALIYQILVDRFYDQDPSNNPPHTKAWSQLPDRHTYYGGDFQGIIAKLDYLVDFGVEIIYLSPVFLSPSYHKYDVADYSRIEPIYGGKEALKDLVVQAHARGIKIILDGVFNHCSSEHPFFQDVLKNQEDSPYRHWFKLEGFPVSVAKGNYDHFANQVPTMPKFNTAHQEVIEYLTAQSLYWVEELGIDGYRLDVADEVSHRFWRHFYQSLKAKDSNLLILGEIWNYPTSWLIHREMDSVTHYKLRQLMLELMTKRIDVPTFIRRYQRQYAHYPTPFFTYLVSLAGSHDTLRLIRAVKAECLHHLTLRLMLALPGLPLIYYGDEYALDGGEAPDNRRAMIWDNPPSEAAEMTKKFARLRSASPVLKKGRIQFLEPQPHVLRFLRTYQNQKYLIVLNLSEEDYIEPLPIHKDLLNDQQDHRVNAQSIRWYELI
jgi:glycosidase